MFNRVVVGIDERSAGCDGIALARKLTARGGQLALAYLLTSDPLFYRGAGAAVAEAERARAVKLLETARELAATSAELRCATSSSVGVGLHEIAEEFGAGLLVLGSSVRGLLGRVLVGDDTQASLNGASCAVAIAPAGYSQGAGSIGEVGVGYDDSPESQAAVELARVISAEHGAGRAARCPLLVLPRPGAPTTSRDANAAELSSMRRGFCAADHSDRRII
jgi:nucleotide-binding universal stress UspA family protein